MASASSKHTKSPTGEDDEEEELSEEKIAAATMSSTSPKHMKPPIGEDDEEEELSEEKIAATAMVSTSSKHAEDDEEESSEEELERFDDFSIVSPMERLISKIEAICRRWLADGPIILMQKGAQSVLSCKNLYMVNRELKYGEIVYSIEYYFMKSAKGKCSYWDDDTHSTQLSFGVDDFLIIAPLSASGVILDDPEVTKLLSSIAIALSNCGSNWPAFVPLHDPSRKAYKGIQHMGTAFTRRFEADQIGSKVPLQLMDLKGLHELFLSKIVPLSTDFPAKVKVNFSMKLTYRTPELDHGHEETSDSESTEPVSENDDASQPRKQWDDDCPWAEWYSAEDPVKGFELTAIWGEKMIEKSLDMAELENASLVDANSCLLHPVVAPYMVDDSIEKFVRFASQLNLLVNAFELSGGEELLEDYVADSSAPNYSKSSVTVAASSFKDRVMKDLFSEEVGHSNRVEAESKYGHALKGAPLGSLFSQFCLHALWFGNYSIGGVRALWFGNCDIRAIAVLWRSFVHEIRSCWKESKQLPKMKTSSSIDLSACLIHQKLQMLAICIERKKFLNHKKEIRKGSAGIVPLMMLINTFEKMHAPYTQDATIMTEDMHEEMLHGAEASENAFGLSGQLERDLLSSDMSAFKAANPDAVFEDFIRWHSPGDWVSEDKGTENSPWPPKGRLSQRMSEHGSPWRKLWNDAPALPVFEQKSLFDSIREGEKTLYKIRKGSAGTVPSMMLINTFEKMHAPYTQDVTMMTEDMHEERLHGAEASENAFGLSGQLEMDLLSSDMSAFKAANPHAVFEDFIRWHSPGDWVSEEKVNGNSAWPPKGRLSQRMSEHGLWRKFWNDAPALPVYEQKSLFDSIREGEKVVHYLETLGLQQLLKQMVCTAFKSSADILNMTTYGGFELMKNQMDQLYATMASALKSLEGNSDTSGLAGDLKRLCQVFEHIEKLMILAASVHRKLHSPRLAQSIFTEYCNYYLPKIRYEKEFTIKEKVEMLEREAVSNLFRPPTADVSWSLNDHEPIRREIVFSVREKLSNLPSSSPSPSCSDEQMETHRMYVSGTSDDLWVASSMTSWD